MKVWEEKHKLRLPQDTTRSVGLHVSDIIKDLAVNGNILDKKWVKEISLELQNTNMMQIGLAWEDYLDKTKQHPEIHIHPGELSVIVKVCARCGYRKANHHLSMCKKYKTLVIYLSPDGITWEDGIIVLFLNEFKFTLKSCRDFADGLRRGAKKSIMWVWQVMSYCYACKTLAAKLHVMFGAGNYSYDSDDPDSIAAYKIFRFEFTQEELDSNWDMIVNHAIEMIQSRKVVLCGE